MGLWGAAQGLAAGFGGFVGAMLADLLRLVLPVAPAFAGVFVLESLLFVTAAVMAWRVIGPGSLARNTAAPVDGAHT